MMFLASTDNPYGLDLNRSTGGVYKCSFRTDAGNRQSIGACSGQDARDRPGIAKRRTQCSKPETLEKPLGPAGAQRRTAAERHEVFYGSIGAVAAASLVSVLGASLAASEYRTPFAAFAAMSFIAGAIGFVALVVGCVFLVTETRLALQSMYEETQLARGMSSGK